MGEPAEITVIRTNIERITDEVIAGNLLQFFANSLVEQAFISRRGARGILSKQGIADDTKASNLLDSVFTKLRAVETSERRQWFKKFIGIFSKEASLAELVTKLNQDLEKLSPTQSTTAQPSPPPPAVTPEITPLDFAGFPKPELVDLLNLVGVDVQVHWRQIGLGLGLKPPELDVIQQTHRGAVNPELGCITQVFTKWHNGKTSEYSWKKLAEVLCSPLVNQKHLLAGTHAKLSRKN